MLTVHLENRRVQLKRRPMPRRLEGFALIRLLCGGICNTDLELQRGYYGFRGTPGHEFVGEVVDADSPNLLGRRVVGEINLHCNRCEWCFRGLGRHCPSRKVLGIVKHPGAFAEFLTLPEQNLHVLPRSLSTDQAVFIEPLAAACEILEQVSIPPGARVAVLGDGKLGTLIALALHANGIDVQHYGRHRNKLRITESAGIGTELVRKKLPRAAYQFVVEATGSRFGLAEAVSMVRPRGTVIMKSTIHGAVHLDTALVIVPEITLVGSRCGRFGPALALLEQGKVKVEGLISDRFALDDAPRAFRRASESGILKVLLTAP